MAFYIGLDTETCNGLDNGRDLTQSLVYDLGLAVVDENGKVYETRSFVIYEIFVGMKDVMKEAYFADKIPQYEKDIKEGTRKLVRFSTARFALIDLMKKYNTNKVFAHNAQFDYRALLNTQRYTTCSKYRWFFPYGVKVIDTLEMSKKVFKKDEKYVDFCRSNGYMTKHKTPQVRLTAEILYRYITNENSFDESHTGLEDVLIEKEIFKSCYNKCLDMVA